MLHRQDPNMEGSQHRGPQHRGTPHEGIPTWRDPNTGDLNMGGPQHERTPTWRDPNMEGPQHGGRDLNMGYFSMEGPQHRGTSTRRDPNIEGYQHGKTLTWRYLSQNGGTHPQIEGLTPTWRDSPNIMLSQEKIDLQAHIWSNWQHLLMYTELI